MYLQDLYNAAVLAKESTENAVRLQLEADRIKALKVLQDKQIENERYVLHQIEEGNITKPNMFKRVWTRFASFFGKLPSFSGIIHRVCVCVCVCVICVFI